MRKYMIVGVILLSVLSFAKFGLILDNVVVPGTTIVDIPEDSGMFITMGGLRLSLGFIDLGAVTPVYVGVYAPEGMMAMPVPAGLLWILYGGLKVGDPIYLYGRGAYVLKSQFGEDGGLTPPSFDVVGIAGAGINLANLFIELGTLFSLDDIANTVFKLYHVGIGLRF